MASAAAQWLPWDEATELANTAAQRLGYGRELPEDALEDVIQHRVLHRWISLPRADIPAFVATLVVAWRSAVATTGPPPKPSRAPGRRSTVRPTASRRPPH